MSYNAESLRETEGVSVHSGFPNPATDTSLRTLDLNKILVAHSASTYFFRVRGRDWEDSGIFDGDVAIVDRALDPRPADVVLWWGGTHGQFSVSTYKRMPSDAALWGVITSTIHQFRKVIPT